MTTTISCQYTDCEYVAEHSSEAVAIAMLTSHNNIHSGASNRAATKQKVPKIDRPELKQDISDEEWQSFEAEWRRFKRCTEMSRSEVPDQLFQCCERSLARLLLKEDPKIIESGEDALLDAMRKMAVLHVATTVRRTNLMSLRQEHGQTFREYFANVRAAAATCEYSVKCTNTCCNDKNPVDYTSMVVKDILISGIEDSDITKDVLAMPELDSRSDKDIVKFVEEKEIARNALQTTLTASAVSSYNRARKSRDANDNSAAKKKLSLRGKCAICAIEILIYKQYKSGKMNREPFKFCLSCHKKNSKPQEPKPKQEHGSETVAVLNFIAALDVSKGTEVACTEVSHPEITETEQPELS